MTDTKCAIFTIVKDEKFFLPIWLRYYKQYFDNTDIYILDHQSTDGSTNNLDVNVVKIYNDIQFDHLWLVITVQNFQQELLTKYKAVIFTEVDEILYSLGENFDDLINRFIESNDEFMTCYGYEIMQNLDSEPNLSDEKNIMSQRKFWFRYDIYDKTLLSKIPIGWNVGFHYCNYPKKYDNLYMIHLHRMDFNLMFERHNLRTTTWNLSKKDLKKGWGRHNFIGDKDGVLNIFNMFLSKRESIPQDHIDSIKNL